MIAYFIRILIRLFIFKASLVSAHKLALVLENEKYWRLKKERLKIKNLNKFNKHFKTDDKFFRVKNFN